MRVVEVKTITDLGRSLGSSEIKVYKVSLARAGAGAASRIKIVESLFYKLMPESLGIELPGFT